MQQSTKTPATSKTWTAPRLIKVGTINDVAGFGNGATQGLFQPDLS